MPPICRQLTGHGAVLLLALAACSDPGPSPQEAPPTPQAPEEEEVDTRITHSGVEVFISGLS